MHPNRLNQEVCGAASEAVAFNLAGGGGEINGGKNRKEDGDRGEGVLSSLKRRVARVRGGGISNNVNGYGDGNGNSTSSGGGMCHEERHEVAIKSNKALRVGGNRYMITAPFNSCQVCL